MLFDYDPRTKWRWPDWLFVAVLVAAVFLVYRPAWHGGALWDDDAHMTKPALRSLEGLGRIWYDRDATQQYYPLLHSAFWVEYRLFGDATTGYHLVNIALHALAAVLLLLVLRKLRLPGAGAYLAAAIFALHPVMVESVAWITELKNTLSGVFYLGAGLAYLDWDEGTGNREQVSKAEGGRRKDKVGVGGLEPESGSDGGTRRWGWYTLALGLFVLGLLSKTVVATLPGALLVVLWWQRGKLSWKRDVLPLVPFFVLGLVGGLHTAWMEVHQIGAEGQEFDLGFVVRCLIAGRVVWFYLGKLFIPAHLIFMYPRWVVSAGVWWQWLYPLGLAGLLTILWLLWRRGKWGRGPLAAVLFFVGTLFPVLGFCNVYPFVFSFVADHFQYLASIGIIVLFAAGIAAGLARLPTWGRGIGVAACVILLVGLGMLTWRQSRSYRGLEKLWRDTLRDNGDCWLAYNNLGILQRMAGKDEEAKRCYERALELHPDDYMAHDNLGLVLAALGHKTEAIAEYEASLRCEPRFARAHNDWGLVLAEMGDKAGAIAHYRTALAIEPRLAVAHNNLGMVLAEQGHKTEAIAHYEAALRLEPEYAKAQNNLGIALASLGREQDAKMQFEAVLRLNPDDADAHSNLGNVLYRQRAYVSAIHQYEDAVRLKPDFDYAHFRLGLALEAVGQMRQAVAHYEQVRRSDPDSVEAAAHAALLLATDPRAGGGPSPERAVALAERAVAGDAAGNSTRAWLALGAAYAGADRYSEALNAAEKARDMARTRGERELVGLAETMSNLYRAGKPYHVTGPQGAPP